MTKIAKEDVIVQWFSEAPLPIASALFEVVRGVMKRRGSEQPTAPRKPRIKPSSATVAAATESD